MRLYGKKSVSEMTVIELIIVLGLSSAAGDPMFYSEVGIAWGIVVIFVVLILYKIQSIVSEKNETVENILKGDPALVIKDGKIVKKAIDKETIAKEELLMFLRAEAIESVGHVREAYLEINGTLSVFKYPQRKRKKGLPTMPEGAQGTQVFMEGEKVPKDSEYASFNGNDVRKFAKGQRFASGKWVKAR